MAKTIQVMLVDPSDATRESLTSMLAWASDIQVIGEARTAVEANQRLSVVLPDVLLLTDTAADDISTVIVKMSMQYPDVSIVVLSENVDTSSVRACMRAGAKDYLTLPVNGDTLVGAIRDLIEREQVRQSKSQVAVLNQQLNSKGQILSFISSKGGVGKTTISVNTAIALAEQGRRVVLVDFDLQFGDVSLLLNHTPTRTSADLVQESTEIDPDVLDRYITIHESGLAVLAAPRKPEESEYVQAAHVRVVLQSLKRKFDYVLVDTAPLANDIFFAILETSDTCYMVNTLNIAVLKNNRMLLDLLGELGYQADGILQILNRANSKNGLKVKDVSRVLKSDIVWEMDSDYRLAETCLTEGTPFVLRDKKNRLSKQIYAFTAKLDGGKAEHVSRRNPLHRMFQQKVRGRGV